MSVSLTRRQTECLAFLRQHMADNGTAPTLAEIGEAMNLTSKSPVHGLLTGLEARGHIRRLKGKRQAIELIPTATSFDLSGMSRADLLSLSRRLDAELQRRAA